MTSVAIHRGMAHDSFAVVAVTPDAARSARQTGPHRPEQATPQAEGLVRARGRACFHTLAPALRGSLPVHGSLGGKAVQHCCERGVAVKQKYGMYVDAAERDALTVMLREDPSRDVTC